MEILKILKIKLIFLFYILSNCLLSYNALEEKQKPTNSTSNSNYEEVKDNKMHKLLRKATKESQALDLVYELIYRNENLGDNLFLLDYLIDKNWKKSFKLAVENLYDITKPFIKETIDRFTTKSKEDISILKSKLSVKKKDIIRISPIFEWSQDDNEIKMRIRFSKNLETPGDKNVTNFKVNCTRAQLEVQAYKEHEDYVVHYYRRLNTYEFIRPYSCKNWKESDGTYLIHFLKNQATLFWNFLNQPSEDHYNLHTWQDVHDKYDGKVQYTEFREHAMENLLISDIDEYLKEKTPLKQKRLKKISKAKRFLTTKNYEDKNYCLSPAQGNNCIIPKVTDWGYWLI
jgi:hypothetical protein